MKVGVIVPINYLNFCKCDLHLCYARFLKDKTYLNFCRTKEVILDSSPNLPRVPSIDSLLEGIRLVNPKYLILPSIDFASTRTVTLHKDFIVLLPKKKSYKLIGVLQGFDLDSLVECYKGIKSFCEVIALPSPLESIARRDEIIRDVGIKELTFYLEVYKNPLEEIPTSNSLGICTSFPTRLAVALKEIYEFWPTPPPLDFYLPEGSLDTDLLSSNIKDYISIVQEGELA